LYFSNGRILLPSSISEIYSRVLYELKTTILKDTKIIQNNMNNIDIELVFDEKQKESNWAKKKWMKLAAGLTMIAIGLFMFLI
jgi:hypothetical protein